LVTQGCMRDKEHGNGRRRRKECRSRGEEAERKGKGGVHADAVEGSRRDAKLPRWSVSWVRAVVPLPVLWALAERRVRSRRWRNDDRAPESGGTVARPRRGRDLKFYSECFGWCGLLLPCNSGADGTPASGRRSVLQPPATAHRRVFRLIPIGGRASD